MIAPKESVMTLKIYGFKNINILHHYEVKLFLSLPINFWLN